MTMFAQFDNFQKAGKDGFENAMKAYTTLSKNSQAIALESADYVKKSFEGATAATEKLFAVKSLDKAFEVQADYVKSTYESFAAYTSKVGELYQAWAKDAFKPFEGLVPTAPVAATKGGK
jgi:hypothetical protein